VQNACFVKYIGFTDDLNLVFVQDSAYSNYYFNAPNLSLVHQMEKQLKVTDVCGSSRYILQALDGKKVIIYNRTTYEVMKAI
jgi:hypothetical protein